MLINSIPKPNFLLSKIVELKDLAYASLVFNQLTKPNIYAFNVMLRGLATTWKKYDFCVELYYKLKSLGLKANNFTYPFLFIACGNVGGMVHGKIGHCLVFQTGLDGDEYVNHSLITMYARCGEMGSARKVFDEIGDRGLVSWNSMISGYSKMGFAKEAIGLFMEMREEGFEPDEMTLVSVLGACGDLGDLGLGRWVDWFVLDKKMENGASSEAIVLFNEMREAGPNPDKVTMIEVLSACSTVGALDLGKWVETHASERGVAEVIKELKSLGTCQEVLKVQFGAQNSSRASVGCSSMKVEKVQSGAPNPICTLGCCSIPEVEKVPFGAQNSICTSGCCSSLKVEKAQSGAQNSSCASGCCSTQKVDRALLEAQSSRCTSKCCSSQIVELLRKFLSKPGDLYQTQIFAKIENVEGLTHFVEILQEADGVILSCGNLGIDLPAEKVLL
ncbi:hypothetical protein SADUNF_Sadunf18G0118600 [Salix dunnii]|uniref:Pyruvate kinase n=1 Tax=Salix dunnii TaxID=1413687 RepID=A0A835J4P9_9ROSI|nr:hypothetical protein SADUNF_Sadunf18G0118600 [Salix dunnii]